jgi:hypothetical protein
MTLKNIKTASLIDLMAYVENANNKAELNSIIFELACRTYVPFSGVNFDDLLIQYGYQKNEKEKANKEGKKPKVK